MIPLRAQIAGNLLSGLLAGLLLALAFAAPAREIEHKSTPFVTQSEMLVISLVARPNQPPEITSVAPLAAGRLTASAGGDHRLMLEDASGKVLYETYFQPVFLIPSDPPVRRAEVPLALVVPAGQAVRRITVSGPAGSDSFDLE